jgi:hypothetical protein
VQFFAIEAETRDTQLHTYSDAGEGSEDLSTRKSFCSTGLCEDVRGRAVLPLKNGRA